MRLLAHELPGDRAAALARVGAIVEEPRFHVGRDERPLRPVMGLAPAFQFGVAPLLAKARGAR